MTTESSGAPRPPSGVIVVDKPEGPTSFQVVGQVRRLFGLKKVGHTGTLDPLACGLLPICVGEATKLVSYLTGQDKTYQTRVHLGRATTTYDREGEATFEASPEAVAALTRDQIEAALEAFRGTIEQRPPAFSAIKVDGRRLHELARAGEAVEAPMRTVTVHRLELLGIEGSEVMLEVHCSKGTYIRSIGHDLGQALGVGGHLTWLRRTTVGHLTEADAVSLDGLSQEDALERLVPPAEAVAHLPTLHLEGADLESVRHGRPIRRAMEGEPILRALNPEGQLLALMQPAEGGLVKVVRGFNP